MISQKWCGAVGCAVAMLLSGCYQNPDPYDTERQQATAGSPMQGTEREPFSDYPQQDYYYRQTAPQPAGTSSSTQPLIAAPSAPQSTPAAEASQLAKPDSLTEAARKVKALQQARDALRSTRSGVLSGGGLPSVGGLPSL